MTTREITIAFELAIGIFAVYLLVRRLSRLGASNRETPPFHVAELSDMPILDSNEPVTVAWFKRVDEAEMWAETLRQAGIEATVGNTNIYSRDPASPQLQVRPEDARRAIEILREADSGEHPCNDQEPPPT